MLGLGLATPYELTKVLNLKRNGKNYSDLAKTLNVLRKMSQYMTKKNAQ